MICKRNADVNVNVHMNFNLTLVTLWLRTWHMHVRMNARRDVTSEQNVTCSTAAIGIKLLLGPTLWQVRPVRTKFMAVLPVCIMKTHLYSFDPHKPHFYKVKLVLQGIHYFSYIDCGYSLEPPQRGGSNQYPQIYVLSRNMKNIRMFYLKIFIFS